MGVDPETVFWTGLGLIALIVVVSMYCYAAGYAWTRGRHDALTNAFTKRKGTNTDSKREDQ